jgi:SAM-dependent methyltransferase
MANFDHTAHNYDCNFTHTPIGIGQRKLVFKALSNCYTITDQSNILELNCGTGEDALYYGKLGASVISTDISSQMVKIAESKTENLPKVTCEVLEINHLKNFNTTPSLDLIFSNFGGLNCLTASELQNFMNNAFTKLKPKGVLALVIMPEFCLWETLYFTSKLDLKNAFRRKKTTGVRANVDGKGVHTHYYSPAHFKKIKNKFTTIQITPIGFFTPPSYLNPFFKSRTRFLENLIQKDENNLDKPYLASFSDHYLICFQKP